MTLFELAVTANVEDHGVFVVDELGRIHGAQFLQPAAGALPQGPEQHSQNHDESEDEARVIGNELRQSLHRYRVVTDLDRPLFSRGRDGRD